VPTFRTPTFAVALPSGDFFDSGARVDSRPTGTRRGETRRVRLDARPAVSF
jgi:hypothetical protein